MSKENAKIILFVVLSAIGGCLIGLNAGRLEDSLHAVLFALGVAMVSICTGNAARMIIQKDK